MKTIRELTLTVITALFVVTVALLWASASPRVSGKSPPPVAFAPLAPTGLAPYAVGLPCLGRFISSALARIRHRNFR